MKVQLKSLRAFESEVKFVKKLFNAISEAVSLLLVCADDIMNSQ